MNRYNIDNHISSEMLFNLLSATPTQTLNKT